MPGDLRGSVRTVHGNQHSSMRPSGGKLHNSLKTSARQAAHLGRSDSKHAYYPSVGEMPRAASTNGAGGFPAPLIKTPGSSRAAK